MPLDLESILAIQKYMEVDCDNIHLETELDKSEFLKCCIGMVAVKDMPLIIFDDEEYFKKIIHPYELNFKTNLSSKNLLLIIDKTAREIRNIISKKINNKLICLKVDIASSSNRSVLGINIQYIDNFKICVHTIGIIQLSKKHSAEILVEEILKCLHQYNVDTKQIYSITTDNGWNVVEISEIFEGFQEESSENMEEYIIANDEQTHLNIINTIFENLNVQLSSLFPVLKCAAYILQLVIRDEIEKLKENIFECKQNVEKIRKFVKNKNLNLPLPTLDNSTTQWTSTYDMIASLLEIKDKIENIEKSTQLNINWNFITNFVNAFKHLAICAKRLQQEEYILGDFFRDWLTCELEIENLISSNPYSESILNTMKARKEQLLQHEAFVSALYLDPRFNFKYVSDLTDEMGKVAVEHLLKTFDVIRQFENVTPTIKSEPQPETSDIYEKLDKWLNEKIFQNKEKKSLKQKLIELALADCPRIRFKSNILKYWSEKVNNDDDLKKLISTVLAVAATQTSVERSFSALALFLTETQISSEQLQNILITKLNFDLIKNINLEYITEDNE